MIVVKDHLHLTFSVVALGPVVASTTLPKHKVVRTEYAPKRSGPRFKSQNDPRSHYLLIFCSQEKSLFEDMTLFQIIDNHHNIKVKDEVR